MFDGLERISYQPGDEIFREGDEGSCAYLIESGAVKVSAIRGKKSLNIGTLGKGELFGEVALIDTQPRTASVTAIKKTRVVRINRELLDAKLAHADPVVEHLLRLILKRFRHTHERLLANGRSTPESAGKDPDKAFSDTQQNLIKHIGIASDINEALDFHQFELYYQPITSIKENRLAGFEALIRWIHPKKGLIPPLQFLDVAEDTDQILPIGTWTLERACRDFHTLSKRHHDSSRQSAEKMFISVNLSARQLTNTENAANFSDILNNAGVDIESIKLEVTETALIEKPEVAQKMLADLRELGFRVSLDDFGTGYSSLSYLQKFPVDDIKIDRSFVSRMFSDHSSMQIIKASIDLANAMDLDVVAEGVETKEDLEQLKNMHCSYAQGYHFSKPLPLTEAVEYSDSIH
ncbi:MAG: EAL domain-containing protein [Gammaproteobacteria bacterium]